MVTDHFVGGPQAAADLRRGRRVDDEAVMTELRRHATEEFSDPDATFVVDGSTFPKKGKQWCGRLAARQQGTRSGSILSPN